MVDTARLMPPEDFRASLPPSVPWRGMSVYWRLLRSELVARWAQDHRPLSPDALSGFCHRWRGGKKEISEESRLYNENAADATRYLLKEVRCCRLALSSLLLLE